MKISKIKKETFIYNSFLIILSGFIVKGLGLINKIFITRLLGTNGMNLYILCFPTILLFISLSSFSLNISTSKLIAESLKSRIYSPKKIIKESIKLGIKISLIFEILFLLIFPIIISKLLLNKDLFYPLLMSAFLYPIVGVTDTLRGALAGLKLMKNVALVNILEQVFRFSFSIIALIILKDKDPIISVSFTILALAVGELASLFYLVIKLRKINIPDIKNTISEKDAIKKIAIPTTISKLIGNISYFLEPILNTLILSYLGYNINKINTDYTIINAYIIPLLTITSFLSTSIATTVVPSISESVASNNTIETSNLINKSFFLSIIPGLIISIILFLFPLEYLKFFFQTTLGSEYVKKFVFVFLIHYIQAPGIAILQALGKSKLMFSISSIFNILRLLLIITLPFFTNLNTYSLLYSIILTMVLETTIIWIFIIQITNFKLDKKKIIEIVLISIIILNLGLILSSFKQINFIITSSLLFITYYYFIIKFKLI